MALNLLVKKLARNPGGHHFGPFHGVTNPMLCSCRKASFLRKVCSDGGQAESFASQKQSPVSAKFLMTNLEESRIIKKTARSALLELAKDQYNRILVLEEGLVAVPFVGAAAYKSFRPALYSWPSLPDGTEIEHRSRGPSRYGASELLIGLNIDNENVDLEEAKMNAVVGQTQQQFLARIGAIEIEGVNKSNSKWSSCQNTTLLPWMDAVARLVLILSLEDE